MISITGIRMNQRKPAEAREKDLRLAIMRIERGRAHTKETKLSIASVAREAGVSKALIHNHNHYPAVAESIRLASGRSSRAQRDLKREQLKQDKEKARMLRQEILELRAQRDKLASINEVLIAENLVLRAKQADPKVVDLEPKKLQNG